MTVDRRAFGFDQNLAVPGGGVVLGEDVRIEAQLELVQVDG
jgi:hypothetical protein